MCSCLKTLIHDVTGWPDTNIIVRIILLNWCLKLRAINFYEYCYWIFLYYHNYEPFPSHPHPCILTEFLSSTRSTAPEVASATSCRCCCICACMGYLSHTLSMWLHVHNCKNLNSCSNYCTLLYIYSIVWFCVFCRIRAWWFLYILGQGRNCSAFPPYTGHHLWPHAKHSL